MLDPSIDPRTVTERAILFLHGFTNSPQQFAALGEQFFRLGYNVFIPRLPRHGLSDRLTRDLKNLTEQELLQFGETMLDLTLGLGQHVAVSGLSLGGLLAAWIGQHRAEVAVAAPIAPEFGLAAVPGTCCDRSARSSAPFPISIFGGTADQSQQPSSYPFAYPDFPRTAWPRWCGCRF